MHTLHINTKITQYFNKCARGVFYYAQNNNHTVEK